MIFRIITLFPEAFPQFLNASILKRAQEKGLVEFSFINPRNFAKDKYKTVDDKPYGGGPGMVLKADPIVQSIESIPGHPFAVLLSASGKAFTQKMARKIAGKPEIALVCGHYEGVDARVEKFVDETISVGDFILSSGETAALVVIDAVTRLVPGVIKDESTHTESFQNPGLLEAPQYTRPDVYRNLKVPKILLGGNHGEIEKWRKEQSLKRTKKLRPDLLKKF